MAIAKRWIEQGYPAVLVLNFVGIQPSTYYYNISKPETQERKASPGRPVSEYSCTKSGAKVSDEQIKEFLMEHVTGDGYPYGYKKLTVELQEENSLIINHKKVYRLCKELNILRPQRQIKVKHPRKLANRRIISASNELWQMDLKYGYIAGIDRFFFIISVIDVYDRNIIAFHIGLTATALDASRVLKEAFLARGLNPNNHGVSVRTDNGPQFVANRFQEACEKLKIVHERIPNNTPNLTAFIESFHALLEGECLVRHEFETYAEAYKAVCEYMSYYNNRRRHGSLGNSPPARYYRENINRLCSKEMLA